MCNTLDQTTVICKLYQTCKVTVFVKIKPVNFNSYKIEKKSSKQKEKLRHSITSYVNTETSELHTQIKEYSCTNITNNNYGNDF